MSFKTKEERNEYMKEYMRKRRGLTKDDSLVASDPKPAADVKPNDPTVNTMLKLPLNAPGVVSIYLIDGQYVRDNIWIDYTEGGHDLVYDWIPANEVWIDFDINSGEVLFVMCHELSERIAMSGGMTYDDAHTNVADKLEVYLREHPDEALAKFEELCAAQQEKSMNTKYKTFRPEVKSVDVEDGTIEMLIPMSTGSMDISKEVILPSSWDNEFLTAFMKRPVMVSSHDYSDLRKQIGEWLQLTVTDQGLFAKPKYYINQGNEEADWAFNLASKGMAAFSVGFNPIEYKIGKGKNDPAITYTKNQLLEISHVIVPCNQDAMMAMRGKSADSVINQLIEDIANAEIVFVDEEEKVTKTEVTDNTIRIPVPGEEGKHTDHKIRTIAISKKDGISGLYCVDCKKVITYIFDTKDHDWTKAKAEKWIKDHTKQVELFVETRVGISDLKMDEAMFESLEEAIENNLHGPKKVSQKELEDEFDYILTLLNQADSMSKENKQRADDLMNKVVEMTKREPESDISVNDKVQIAQIIAREIAKHYI